MTLLDRTKEFFNIAKKGMLILVTADTLVFNFKSKNIRLDKETICELLEDWLYENNYECLVVFTETDYGITSITSFGVDILDYLDKIEDRRKIRILTEMYFDKINLKYI